MNQTERNYVKDCVEQEGFDYAFRHYSTFDSVKDQTFHNLRQAYIGAAMALMNYVGIEE